jgi:hypothetical protein
MLATCFSTAPSLTTSALRDGGVGAPLRHEPQDLALARGQDGERVDASRRTEKLGDDFGVQGGTSYGDPLERFDEVADVGHPVLQQVADAGGVVGQQVGGVAGLDVLGEQQDAQPLVAGAELQGQTEPSSVKVGGMRMSMTATSGGFWATELRSAAGSPTAPVMTKPRSTRSWTRPSRRMAESSAMAMRRAPTIRWRAGGRR